MSVCYADKSFVRYTYYKTIQCEFYSFILARVAIKNIFALESDCNIISEQ
jgi:hypothetical protein